MLVIAAKQSWFDEDNQIINTLSVGIKKPYKL